VIAAELGATIIQSITRPFKWWTVIAEWEQGIRVRLGQNSKLLKPGIHFRIPWVDRIYVQSVRLRTFYATGITCRTKDGKTAVFSLATHFRVKDVLRMYNELSSPETTIEAMAVEQAIALVESQDADTIRASDISAAIAMTESEKWGLEEIHFAITGFTCCRAIRVLMNDYNSTAGMNNLDQDEGGERK
jgi:hypothetical protein